MSIIYLYKDAERITADEEQASQFEGMGWSRKDPTVAVEPTPVVEDVASADKKKPAMPKL